MALIYDILNMAIEVMMALIIIRALLSFFPHNPRQYVVRFIYDVTSPLLNPIQRVVPPIGMVDISPLIAWLLLSLIQRSILPLLLHLF